MKTSSKNIETRTEGYYLVNNDRVLYWDGEMWLKPRKVGGEYNGTLASCVQPNVKQAKSVKSPVEVKKPKVEKVIAKEEQVRKQAGAEILGMQEQQEPKEMAPQMLDNELCGLIEAGKLVSKKDGSKIVDMKVINDPTIQAGFYYRLITESGKQLNAIARLVKSRCLVIE